MRDGGGEDSEIPWIHRGMGFEVAKLGLSQFDVGCFGGRTLKILA